MADDLAVSYYRHRHRQRYADGGKPRPRRVRHALVTLYYNFFQNRDDSACSSSDSTITVNNEKIKTKRKQKKQSPNNECFRNSVTDSAEISTDEYLKIMAKKCSMPNVSSEVETPRRRVTPRKWRRSETYINSRPLLQHPLMQAQLRIYRCQVSTKQESCCCSCNSDAMFEVMKSLYDCYKKKDCNNCNCILCAHLPREERKLGEARKSRERVSVGVETASTKKKTKETMKTTPSMGPLEPLAGMSPEEKEKALKDLVKKGGSLPEGRTYSEKKIIEKVAKDLGVSMPEKLRKAKAAGLLTPIDGKSDDQKEKIVRGLALNSLPLPEAKTASERKITDKVRQELGLPPEPKNSLEKLNYTKAQAAGLITPLEGKSKAQKEMILKGLAERGIPLPEGRTPSERALIQKTKAEVKPTKTGIPSEKNRRAKASGLLTPLEGKTSEQKEKIIRGLAMSGLPLPEAKTASEKKIVDKVSKVLGLPPVPKTSEERHKFKEAQTAGIITPLEGKTRAQKEKILASLQEKGIPMPEGRTSSERALIQKIKAEVKPLPSKPITPSAKIRKAKEAGLMTPLEGKTSDQKEKIIRGLAMSGAPLPEAKSASEKKIINKTRRDLGLPPEPKTASERQLYNAAQTTGLITPLEGKSNAQKEKILSGLAEMGIPLPEGRTPSEQALIRKIKAEIKPLPALPPEERRKLEEKTAKVMKEGKGPSDECICSLLTPVSERMRAITPTKPGFITPLEGKTASEKERILKGRVAAGLPMPEAKTASERALIKKVKAETGYVSPVARTLSAKERQAKAAGLLTPLEGKTSHQKETILRGRAKAGIPLPEGKTASEKKIIKKIRAELGLPSEPTTRSLREKMTKAQAAGIITPLEGKSPAQKEQILKRMAAAGIPLPEGRTPSEKALIKKIVLEAPSRQAGLPSAKMREARAAGLLTPLEGKTTAQKQKIIEGLANAGIPLPEAKTASEKKIIEKVRTELGLPPEPTTRSLRDRMSKAHGEGIITRLEGKTSVEKRKILKRMAATGIPLPEGRTASEKALVKKIAVEAPSRRAGIASAKLREARAAGLMTPLAGKSLSQQEKILRGLTQRGIPLPEGKTASENKIIEKVRADLGLPPEPTSKSMREKMSKAVAAGIISPLEGKTPSQKEKILKNMAAAGIPLPEGRTASERALVKKIAAVVPSAQVKTPSQKMREAKAAGLLTPLEGKTQEQKERIIKGLAKAGIPLPEPKTASEKRIIDKVRADLGLPKEPTSRSMKERMSKALAAGIVTPLEGKTTAQKQKILKDMAAAGIPLPEGRTASEKSIIKKIKASRGISGAPLGPPPLPPENRRILDEKTAKNIKEGTGPVDECICPLLTPESDRVSKPAIREMEGLARQAGISSAKVREARAAGLMTPLAGKSASKKEQILKGLAKAGIPLPEATTASEKKIVDKVRAELGLPPEPTTKSARERMSKAQAAGIVTPLEGKTAAQKEKIIKDMAAAGVALPEGRTSSEKALIKKIAVKAPARQAGMSSAKIREAKAAGLMTPLAGKSASKKEQILTGLAKAGIPLPEATTASEKKIIDKVRAELGLPPEPTTRSARERMSKAQAAGIVTPLEGKTAAQKEKILNDMAAAGVALPEGRTSSEKALIKKIAVKAPARQAGMSSAKIREAKAAGLITPLAGKSASKKEQILTGLAKAGIPLPEATTASEKKIIDKVRAELGLPPEPTTRSARERMSKAQAAGTVTPLDGKTAAQKENILRDMAAAGVALPEGRTASEKAMIKKVSAELPTKIPSKKIRAAKAAGLLTPLEGKTQAEKERIIKGLVKSGIPLPEPKTSSEREVIAKVRAELGLPPEPKTASIKEKMEKAQVAGLLTPLEGKSSAQKEKILKSMAAAGIPLPEGRTASEKSMIKKIKAISRASREISREPLGPPPLPPEKRRILDEKTAKNIKEGTGPVDECICPLLTPESDRVSKPTTRELEGLARQAGISSAKVREAKAAGLMTPLAGKSASKKEKILKGLAKAGIPLPEATTASEKKVIDKVRAELGLPPEPTTRSARERMSKAQAAGIVTPLEGKTAAQKEKILKDMAAAGVALPEGRTSSEKALVRKIAVEGPAREAGISSVKIRQAKAAGLLTPLQGKTRAQQEKVLKGLAKMGLPLPEGQTPSQKRLIQKVRADLGLPPAPTTGSIRERMSKAHDAGIITPLVGKSAAEKEKILKNIASAGVPLPEGKTSSERALIKKIEAEAPARRAGVPSAKLREARAAGLLTPLEGKTTQQKEKILRGLAKSGMPLPEAKSPSEKKIIEKVRTELGLPPEPTTKSVKERMSKAQAAGIISPLEGKTPSQKEKILKNMAAAGIPLPEGRTASERALIKKIAAVVPSAQVKTPSQKMREAKAAGLLTPLEGKTQEQKERIIKGLAKAGIPLPEPKTASEEKIIDKVRADLGLPKEPTSRSMKERMSKALAAGIVTPLEGKTTAQKQKILKDMAAAGIPLPEGKTASEKSIIKKIKASRGISGAPLGPPPLPPEKRRIFDEKTAKNIKEGTGPVDECICPLLTPESDRVSKPTTRELEGLERQAGISSAKVREARAAGLMTPLAGKSASKKEKILKGLAKAGIPLPEATTASEKKIVDKVRAELGLPPEPTTRSARERMSKAQAAGIVTPLEGKTAAQKEKVLRDMAAAGVALPEGRTSSEKALIKKIEVEAPARQAGISSAKIQEAKAAGLITPLAGKSASKKEQILRGLAKAGIPLPEATTASEKKIVDKVRAELGLPPEPTTRSARERMSKAQAAGIVTPLEGKTAAQKEKILKDMAAAGVALPEGRTSSEKALVRKIAAEDPARQAGISSAKIREAKAAGLLTPLQGKTPAQQEKILKGLAKMGLPLPEGQTPSQKRLIQKVRAELGLPPAPTSRSIRERMSKAHGAGIITPLEGKSTAEKKKILKKMASAGVPLPEGRTSSERALIKKIEAEAPARRASVPSAKLREARAAGLLTPLEGKTTDQKEKILRGLAKSGIPMPEAKTQSEKRLMDKVRTELGLPPEPTTRSMKEKLSKAQAAGIVTPLEGKTKSQKEKILKGMASAGVPLPEGRTASEKALIKAIAAEGPSRRAMIPSAKIREAKAAGLLTPLAGKTQSQQEKILRGLAKAGIPLPEGKTPSERKVIQKVRAELGLPPEPTTKSIRERMSKAQVAGIITPLEGKTPQQKEEILRNWGAAGIPLPEGRTLSEKALIRKIDVEVPHYVSPLEGKSDAEKAKILKKMTEAGIPLPEGETPSEKEMIRKAKKESKAAREYKKEHIGPPALPPESRRKLDEKTAKVMKEGKGPSDECICPLLTPESDRISKAPSRRLSKAARMSEKLQKAQERGLLTPLEGKTKSEKERIIKGLADAGLPLPEATTQSEKSILKKVAADKLKQAKERGLLTPLTGKSKAEQERIVKSLAEAGLPLPEGKTASQKSLIKKVKTDYEITPSEKKNFRTTKSGTAAARQAVKGMATRSRAGIREEVEEILKTTTCERGCGCDKKKIRFKHSYVKIRVTSPDISSFCACPDECIPGVKGGVFTDSEGIKVTVGTATGVPSLSKQITNPETKINYKNKSYDYATEESESCRESHISLEIASLSSDSLLDCEGSDSNVYIYNSETDVSVSDIKRLLHRSIYEQNLAQCIEELVPREKPLTYPSCYNEPTLTVKRLPRPSKVTSSDSYDEAPDSSSGSFYVIETESSDSTQSTCTVDVLSLLARKLASSTDIFNGRQRKHEEWRPALHETIEDAALNLMPVFTLLRKTSAVRNRTLRGGSEARLECGIEMGPSQPGRAARRCASAECLSTASSICIVMSSSGRESCSDCCDSTICFEMIPKLKEALCDPIKFSLKSKNASQFGKVGLRIANKGGKFFMEGPQKEDIEGQMSYERLESRSNMKCQTSHIKFRIQESGHAVSMDTMVDRPCCCAPSVPSDDSAGSQDSQDSDGRDLLQPPDQRCVAAVISDFMDPSHSTPGLKKNYMNIGYSQTPSSFHTKVTCQRADSKVMWDLPSDKPCTPETCHSNDLVLHQKWDTGDGQKPACTPATCQASLPPHQNYTGDNAGVLGCTPVTCRSKCSNEQAQQNSFCTPATCHSDEQNQFPPNSVPLPPQPGMGPDRYSGMEFSPEIMRVRPTDKADSESVGVGATCSMLSNLLGQKAQPNASTDPPFIYEGKILKDLIDRCTSTEELIRTQKAMLRQVSADNMAREKLVDRNLATDGQTCKCVEKACGPGRWRRKKNHICECPPEPPPPPPEPEPQIEFDWSSLDVIQKAFSKEQRKMRSDLTQTMSGFKVLRKRKQPQPLQPVVDELMSFEDALAYYEAHPEEAPPPEPGVKLYDSSLPGQTDKVKCKCPSDLPRNKRNECECPPSPEEPETSGLGGRMGTSGVGAGMNAEHFPGLKFYIGGKGSATPGLTGICCFDFTEGSISSCQDCKSDSESSY